MKRIAIASMLPFLLLACNPQGQDEKGIDPKQAGLVFNEIAAHDEFEGVDSWIELCNPTAEEISLDGLGIFVTDAYFKGQGIATLSGKLAPGEKKIISTADESLRTGVASDKPFTLVLGPDKNNAIDRFERKEGDPSIGFAASWQRMPDASGDWKRMTYATPGRTNEVFDIKKYRNNAVWTWGSHMGDLLADDAAKLKNLKELGYDHIILNYSAFDNFRYETMVKKFMTTCNELDVVVHGWIQCFNDGRSENNGWFSPIDDEKKCYIDEVFETIQNNARRYIEDYGVKGIHLDYIRFGGTAYKHNHSAEVTAVGAVNRCCREIREVCDSFDEGRLVTSAALMPEANSEYYYAQVPSQMSQWIDILMPMIYRYGGYNMSDKTFQGNSNYFATEAAKAGGVSWSGIQTYDAATVGMSAEKIRRDIDLMAETKATGIVLFRYQLGTFPDVKDIDWSKNETN